MRLDIGIELRRRKRAANHIAFELCHIDAVCRKAAERLIERCRDVANAEQEGCNGWRTARWPLRFARHDQKACRVVLSVFDVLLQGHEAVNLAGKLGSDSRDGWVAARRDFRRGPCSVGCHYRGYTERTDQLAALRQRMNMAPDRSYCRQRSAGQRQ